MATISLRVYNREIESLIESGKLDQAIAHCQHILKSYSMHIGTYQLLGKAYLEAHRFADATDIFQRILNAAPDDFISHVGMSIIRDDEGKLNDSIWHMERAYEVQPSNPAIQGELRRLYGKRDGVEPAKIRLSREALANMYAQGELFSQAIAEIRAVLTDDPERPDLQVMLARAYYQTGQKVEAAEMAAHLLKKYPYCADALRVLVEVMPGSANTENIQVYQQRLKLLDPYSPYTTDTVFHTEQVPDDSVALEKLEYLPETQTGAGETAWASNLGINLGRVSQQETIPSTNELTPPVESTAVAPIVEPTAMEEVATTGVTEEDAEEISKADMPDWLISQVPTDLELAPTFESTPSEGENALPEWLTSLNEEDPTEAMSSIIQPVEEVPSILETNQLESEVSIDEAKGENSIIGTTQDEIKETKAADEGFDSWLEKLAGGVESGLGEKTESEAVVQPTPELNITTGHKNIPDISTSPIDTEPPIETILVTNDIPDTSPSVEIGGPENGPDAEKVKIDDIPDWIHSLATESEPTPEQPTSEESMGTDSSEEEISPLGIQNKEENLDNIPDWLKEIHSDQPQAPDVEKIEEKVIYPQIETNVQEPGTDEDTRKLVVKARQEETTPLEIKVPEEDASITAWLKRLDESTSAKNEQEPEQEIVANTEEDLPVWLRNLEKDKGLESEIPEPVNPVGETEAPDWLNQRLEPIKEQPDQPKEPEGKGMTWLEDENASGKQAIPTVSGEWVPEEPQEIKPTVGETQSLEPEPAIEAGETSLIDTVPGSVPVEAIAPAVDKDTLILSNAQNYLQGKQANEAAQEYMKLIKKGKYLPEVKEKLLKAIEQYPDNSMLWQTLGDTYMRSNKLQDALDAYGKAESFLQ